VGEEGAGERGGGGGTFVGRATSEELDGVEELGRQGLAVEHGPQLLALGWATLRRLP